MRRGRRCRFLGLVLLVFAAFLSDSAAQPRRELRVGAPGVPAELDPASALDGVVPLIARQVFDTLVAYAPASTDVEPALATRWSVSRDGLTWSFTLRDTARFHDGTPLTAADVVASLARALAPEGGAPAVRPAWAALLRGVPGVLKEVRAADARTVQIVVAQPYAPLLTVLAHPALSIVKAGTSADGVPRLLGTGPYRVAEGASGRLVLEAQGNHWSGGGRSERIVFLDIATDDRAEADLDAGTLDVWFPAGPPRRREGTLSVPGLRVGYLAFQTEKEPFSRRKIRQAVAAAIDPVSLGAALDRSAIPLQSFLPPGVWGRREGSPVLGGTREAVRKLLAEGGWPRGLRATLLVYADTGPVNAQAVADALAVSLAAADIPVQVRLEPSASARPAAQSGQHEMVLAHGAVVGGDPHLFLFPLSTSEGASKGRAQNLSFYRNPRVDDLLIRGSQLSFRAERQRLYQRAQAMLADDLPWIPIYVRLEWAVVRGDVRGLRLHPTGVHRLDTAWAEGGAR